MRNGQANKATREILRKLGKNYSPSEAQVKLYLKWTTDWHFSHDAILEACELTAKGDPSLGYLDGILNSLKQESGDDLTITPESIRHSAMRTEGLKKVLKATSMGEVYNQLRDYPLIGDFLAYQYTIDFNYSPYLNFDEDSFVKAGVGAVRGIKKCFSSYGNDYEDAIYYIHDHFEELQKRYGYTEFRPLPGRKPKLIDLQNCFCETDKYLRAKMPELKVGNVRIKQHYKPSMEGIDYYFPEKWGVEEHIQRAPLQQTLFTL